MGGFPLRAFVVGVLCLSVSFVLLPSASALPTCSVGWLASESASNAQYPVNQDRRILVDGYATSVAGAGGAFGSRVAGASTFFAGRQAQIAGGLVVDVSGGNVVGGVSTALAREISATGVEFLPAVQGAAVGFLTPLPTATVNAAGAAVGVWGQAVAWQQADVDACV